MNKKAVIEMLKEAGRIALFAGLTALVGYFSQVLTSFDPSSVYYIVGTLVLRLVDKFIHENRGITASGVAPF